MHKWIHADIDWVPGSGWLSVFIQIFKYRTISVVPPWYLHCVKVTYDSFLQLKKNCTHSTSNTEYFVGKTIDQKLIVSSIIC